MAMDNRTLPKNRIEVPLHVLNFTASSIFRAHCTRTYIHTYIVCTYIYSLYVKVNFLFPTV